MELANVKVGAEGSLSVKVEAGVLKLVGSHVHESGKIALQIEENAEYFLDKLAAAIPGAFDDAVIALAKAAIKSIP